MGPYMIMILLLRDRDPVLNPFSAFLTLQGLETLDLHGKRHSENALTPVKRWEKQSQVT